MSCPHKTLFSCDDCIKQHIRENYDPSTPSLIERLRDAEKNIKNLAAENAQLIGQEIEAINELTNVRLDRDRLAASITELRNNCINDRHQAEVKIDRLAAEKEKIRADLKHECYLHVQLHKKYTELDKEAETLSAENEKLKAGETITAFLLKESKGMYTETQKQLTQSRAECESLREACKYIPDTLRQAADIIEEDRGGDIDEECEGVRELAAQLKEALSHPASPEHDNYHVKYQVLQQAVKNLYQAAHWTPDREVDEKILWENLRDAVGIQPGNSPHPASPKEAK